jgi:hypothetical protein
MIELHNTLILITGHVIKRKGQTILKNPVVKLDIIYSCRKWRTLEAKLEIPCLQFEMDDLSIVSLSFRCSCMCLLTCYASQLQPH